MENTVIISIDSDGSEDGLTGGLGRSQNRSAITLLLITEYFSKTYSGET